MTASSGNSFGSKPKTSSCQGHAWVLFVLLHRQWHIDFLPGTAHQEPLHATPEAGKAGATAEWIAAGADATQT